MLFTRTALAAMVVVALAAMHGLTVGGSLVPGPGHRPPTHVAVVAPGAADTVSVSHAGSGGESEAPAHHEVAGAQHCVAVLSASPSAPRVTAAPTSIVTGVAGTGAQSSPTACSPAEPRTPDLSQLCLLRI